MDAELILDDGGPRKVGDTVELRAAVWLMEQGYEVFRNVAATGPIDLVAVDASGVPILIDVKKVGGSRTPKQEAFGVRLLRSTSDGFQWVAHVDGDELTGRRQRAQKLRERVDRISRERRYYS